MSEIEKPSTPLRPEKLAAQVTRQLEDEIIDRRWPVGEVLGSETALLDRFGVSRSVLREAVRLLEHYEVARMQRGPRGGLVVGAPDASSSIRALVIYLEYVGISAGDLLRARLLLEPMAARIVAESITEDGIAELRQVAKEEQTHNCGSAADIFGATLVRLSGNPVLQLFSEVIDVLVKRSSPGISSDVTDAPPAAAHAAIVDAIVAGDAAIAQARLTTHLEEVNARSLGSRLHQRSGHMRIRPTDPEPDTRIGRKLAEVTAGRIHDDITSGGWQIGEVLGSESALVDRYGVSRSVLREAVRILEHHSVAEMRRGPGGGLVILAPDPKASIHTIALYLNYQGMQAEHLQMVREAIEMGCIQTVSTTALSPDAIARLGRAVDRIAPGDSSGDSFHSEIVRLADNPVLTLLLRVILELWARNHMSQEPATAAAESETAQIHQKILDALIIGDEGLARHRMRHHLRSLTVC